MKIGNLDRRRIGGVVIEQKIFGRIFGNQVRRFVVGVGDYRLGID